MLRLGYFIIINRHLNRLIKPNWVYKSSIPVLICFLVVFYAKTSSGQSLHNHIGDYYQTVLMEIQARTDVLSSDTKTYDDASLALIVNYKNLQHSVYSFDVNKQCISTVIAIPDTTGRMSVVNMLDRSYYRPSSAEFRWQDNSSRINSVWKVCLTVDRTQTLIFVMSASMETEMTDFLKGSLNYSR